MTIYFVPVHVHICVCIYCSPSVEVRAQGKSRDPAQVFGLGSSALTFGNISMTPIFMFLNHKKIADARKHQTLKELL